MHCVFAPAVRCCAPSLEAADAHCVQPPCETQRDCLLQAAQGLAAGSHCAESLRRCTSATLAWALATENADRSVQVGSCQRAAAVRRVCTRMSCMQLQLQGLGATATRGQAWSQPALNQRAHT